MAVFLSKIIIRSITKVVKNTSRFDLAVDDLIDKFKGGCPPKNELLKIVKQKNQIQTGLNSVVDVLSTLDTTSSTADNLLTGLQTAIRIIKILPVPTGLGLPVGFITTLADSLDTLGDVLKGGKGAISIVPQALNTIISSAQSILQKLEQLDDSLNKCIEDLTQGMNDDEKLALINEIGNVAATAGNVSNDLINFASEEALIAQLSPTSINPLIYRNFKLEIEYDSDNEFSFPSRRIVGKNSINDITIYNLVGGGYSYSTSVKVLIDEIKFRIDALPASLLTEAVVNDVTR